MATRGKIGDKLKELRKLLLELEDLFEEMGSAENEKVEKLLEAFRAHGETLKMSLKNPGAAVAFGDLEDEFLSTVRDFMELKRRKLQLEEKEKEAQYLSSLRKD